MSNGLTWSTLKKRSEFLRVRGGASWGTPAFLLQVRIRDKLDSADVSVASEPRFGFTVTKKMGNAVARNRMRRRLKAAVDETASAKALNNGDYVLVARRGATSRAFPDLVADLIGAFDRVHSFGGSKGKERAKGRDQARKRRR